MAPARGRPTLTQGLDKEVYQVVRKIIDARAQYGPADTRVDFAVIYDEIKRSNSSLNRKPRKILESSIERVLDVIQPGAESDSDDVYDQGDDRPPLPPVNANGLNKSIVGMWATSDASAQPSASTAGPDRKGKRPNMERDSSSGRRLPNGEPSLKRRRGKGAASPSTDRLAPPNASLESLGGVDAVIQQLEDLLVLPMTRPEIYASSKVQPPRGVLIHGPPGCGKTMIANAFAAELGVNFISVSAPSIVSGMSGESEKALRDRFDDAKTAAPCLIFIDEIDAITPKRESAQREMEKRIVAQLLTCMDDLALDKTDGKPVVVLAATNRPDSLDPALRRGGRFDKEIHMSVPSEPVREQILRALTKDTNLAADVDFALLAKVTPGFVGADLSDLVSTAGAAAIKRYLHMVKANSESASLDLAAPEVDPTGVSSTLSSLRRLIQYTREHSLDAGADEASLVVTYSDFLTALPRIQPSALREGFATIPSTTFDSIGALRSHIAELKTAVISPILNPSLYHDLGIVPSSGTLLWGPPGCGKTLLAKACANSSHANFISVKGPELLNKYVGESERAVRQVFNRARSSVPVIIFFDELDALVPRRDGTMSEASARVVNTLLTELDGVGHSRDGIYVIAATNRPDIIDPAMLRPGRLETLLYVGLPTPDERVDILRTLCQRLKNVTFDDEMAAIAHACDGFTGADLEALVRRAGYAAIARSETLGIPVQVAVDDFEAARRQIRPSVSAGEMEKYESLGKHWQNP